VASTLNAIVPYDWAGFLRQRLTETGKPAPVQGFAMNGYKLVYGPEPTSYFKGLEKLRSGTDLSYSIGLSVNKEGEVSSTIWDSPAFKAGVDVGTTILSVNGAAYTSDRLKEAIVAAKNSRDPIRLLVKSQDQVREALIDYHGGPRYPRLEKTGAGDTGLDRLLAPRP